MSYLSLANLRRDRLRAEGQLAAWVSRGVPVWLTRHKMISEYRMGLKLLANLVWLNDEISQREAVIREGCNAESESAGVADGQECVSSNPTGDDT